MRSRSASRSITSPASSVGWRVSVVHSCESPPAPAAARSPASSSSSARTSRLPSAGAIARGDAGARAASSACSASRRRTRSSRACQPRAGRRAGRAQVELGQRGAQVEAGAADHERPPARGERGVDLGVGEAGVRAGAERLARPGRSRAGGARAAPARCGRRGAREDRQPVVDLQRVGGDGDRVLALGAQPLGERDARPRSCPRRSARRSRSRAQPGSIVRRVSVHIATGLSTTPDARAGALEAASAAARGLDGRPCDLAVLFASGAHLAAPEATLAAVHEMLSPMTLVGCGAGGVISDAREVEDGTAVSVWAASLGDGEVLPFHATVEEIEEGSGALSGLPGPRRRRRRDPARRPVLVPDRRRPALPLRGARRCCRCWAAWPRRARPRTAPALFLGEEVVDGGAVGVRLDGVEILPCVSQGAAPIGPELTITAADGHIIGELAGKPALAKLREAIEGLSDDDRELVDGGLLMGIVVDANKPDYVQGDFLVRGLVGADPETGEVAVGTEVRPGQVVRLHARDASSADRDLHQALGVRMEALGGRQPAGALVFACNGRGSGMFGVPGHDAEAVASRAAAARRRRASSRRARSARSAASTSCTASPPRWRSSRGEPRRAERPAHRRDRGHRPGDRAGARRRGARGSCSPGGGPSARAAGGRGRRPRGGVRPRGAPPRSTRLLEEVGNVDVLVANAALPASGELGSFSVEEIDRALAVNLRAPIVLARALSRGDGRARPRPPRVRLLAVGQGGERRAARSTRRRSSGCAGSRSGCARTCATRGVGVSTVFPGFISDAGMFHESGAKLPRLRGDADARGRRRGGGQGDRAQPRRDRRRAARPAARAPPSPGSLPELSGRVQRRLGSLDDRRGDGRGPARQALALGHVLGGAAAVLAVLHARRRRRRRARCGRPCARRCRPRG